MVSIVDQEHPYCCNESSFPDPTGLVRHKPTRPAVVVPEIDGWDRSDGIKAEVDFAIDRGLPVFIYGGL